MPRRQHSRRRQSLSTRSAVVASALVAAALSIASCGRAARNPAPADTAVDVVTVRAAQQPVTRLLRVTGTLRADEEAEVAAETGGRVVATPVERGSVVARGAPLVMLAREETEAAVQEAEANVAQIEVRLGVNGGQPFDVERVPEVASARASRDLAAAEFERIRQLYGEKVVSQSEFDQRRTQADATQRVYETARNTAQQLARSLEASRARLRMARKALADTTVRSPFGGVVVERKVSVGDYVARATKVVTVVSANPLRVELTIPEQSVAEVKAGGAVNLEVEAYPGRTFTGQVRFVSPSVQTDQRAMVVEAILANPDGSLKPGMFVTATIQSIERVQALMVPSSAVRNLAGSRRIYVVKGDRVEERVVTVGQVVGGFTEIAEGVAEGEELAGSSLNQLSDGAKVHAVKTTDGGALGAAVPRDPSTPLR